MKKIILIMMTLWSVTAVHASELSEAYKKEYTFLQAQKSELQSRLIKEDAQQKQDIGVAGEKLEALQAKLIKASDELKVAQENLEKISARAAEVAENGDTTSVVTLQAIEALKAYGVEMDESNNTTKLEKLTKAFAKSKALYETLSSVRSEKGKFFLPNGKPVEAQIVKIGNIAAYGVAKEDAGALAPAGEGQYKLWNAADTSDDAKSLLAGEHLDTLDMYVYENIDKEVEYPKEESFKETLDLGGTIAYFIIFLGIVGIFLLLYRTRVLLKASSNVDEMSQVVIEKLKNGKKDEALEAISKYDGSTAKVIKATLRNIDSDRGHIEDIVTENIINESTRIDQFGNFILVLAAVAPLVGLLGTVTGMITTFQDIAQFGTSDPNLLSGGISEALINTELGLAVAIPLLLGGNLLSGWAQTIKDTMEQSALHIVNIYKKHSIR